MSLDRFVTLWTHPQYPPDAVPEEDLEGAERHLQMRFPDDYRDAILQTGLPRPSIALLDYIVDRESDIRDVNEFLSPEDIVSMTEDWREMGLPETLVAFATDCLGNLFCFEAAPDMAATRPIWFFDHDEGRTEIEAPSFSVWIDVFCKLAPN